MDAVIIYLKDGKAGKSEVVMEIIGDPRQSIDLSNKLLPVLAESNITQFVKHNEFTNSCPSEWLQ